MDRKPQSPWYGSHGVSVPGARLFPQYHRTGKNLCSSAAARRLSVTTRKVGVQQGAAWRGFQKPFRARKSPLGLPEKLHND